MSPADAIVLLTVYTVLATIVIFGTQRDEDDDRREHGVDGQQHDSVGRGHDERQEGQRDEAVAEAGEPEDEERAGDDGGAEGPVEAHAGGGSATARPETQPRAG